MPDFDELHYKACQEIALNAALNDPEKTTPEEQFSYYLDVFSTLKIMYDRFPEKIY